MIVIKQLENNQYEITCDIHSVSKISDKYYLKRNSFCSTCRREEKLKILESNFKNKCSELHNNKYDYSRVKYVKNTIPVIIKCLVHDVEFTQMPAEHLSGKTGCRQCVRSKQPQTKLKDVNLFIKQAKEIHGDQFDYSEVDYKGTHRHVMIKCKKHDSIFLQAPSHHLYGKNGCQLCKNKGHKWSRNDFVNKYENTPCLFYIIKCIDGDEEFYKLGITGKTLNKRYNNYNLPYDYITILEYTDTAANVWDLEYHYKKIFKHLYYKPLKYFHGSSTETFKLQDTQLKDILFDLTTV